MVNTELRTAHENFGFIFIFINTKKRVASMLGVKMMSYSILKRRAWCLEEGLI